MSKEIHWNNSQTQKGVHDWDNEKERGVARRDLVAESRGDETKQKKEHFIPKKAYKIKFNQPAS